MICWGIRTNAAPIVAEGKVGTIFAHRPTCIHLSSLYASALCVWRYIALSDCQNVARYSVMEV